MYDDTEKLYKDFMRAFIRLDDATTEQEASKAFADCISAARSLAEFKYAELVREASNKLTSDLHDDAVRAAGGQ